MTPQEKERAFLHDVSNPLAIASGLLETLLETVKPGDVLADVQIQRLQKIMTAMTKAKTLIKDRRSELIAQTDTGAA